MVKNKHSKIKRKAKRVPETAQMHLIEGELEGELKEWARACDEDFINPDPEKIFLGNMRLKDYLEERGMRWVIRLRELVKGSGMQSFVEGYQATGRKAIHPSIMLGLIMYGMIEGKWSLRELEHLASCDVRAWWLCGGEQPDHSTIGKFINRFQDTLTEEYFVNLTRFIVKNLKITGGDVAGDGTVIEAAASRYRAIKAEAAMQMAEELKHDAEQVESAEKLAKIAKDRIGKAKSNGKNPRKLKMSVSEPEAVFQPLKNGAVRPSYKPSVLGNSHRLIVGKHVDPSDETCAVGPMFEQHERIFGAKPKRALFDAGYHNHEILGMCVGIGIDVLCPSGKADRGEWEKRGNKGKFSKSEFCYDEERDVYVCPAGKELERCNREMRNGRCTYRYQCADNSDCELKARCAGGKSGRRIRRYEGDELKEGMAQVFESEMARKMYGRRKAMCEPVYSELRELQGLNRFHRQGLTLVNLEFSLHCMAYNLKRAIRIEAKALIRFVLALEKGKILLLGCSGWLQVIGICY
jgi:transposase